jgi:hypothetical protein
MLDHERILESLHFEGWEISAPLDQHALQRGEDSFSADDVIDAYHRGKTEFRQEIDTVRVKVFNDNMGQVTSVVATALMKLMENGYTYYRVYLRTDHWFAYEVLVLVAEDAFVDDGFEAIYQFITEQEQATQSDQFNITFSFVPVGKNALDLVNNTAITSDGYIYRLSSDDASQS